MMKMSRNAAINIKCKRKFIPEKQFEISYKLKKAATVLQIYTPEP
jgi:hypothetical protein